MRLQLGHWMHVVDVHSARRISLEVILAEGVQPARLLCIVNKWGAKRLQRHHKSIWNCLTMIIEAEVKGLPLQPCAHKWQKCFKLLGPLVTVGQHNMYEAAWRAAPW